MDEKTSFIKDLAQVSIDDVAEVGGKNASLGEMIQSLTSLGIHVPGGYCVTATAYRYFLKQTGLLELIKKSLDGLDVKNLHDLEKRAKFIREAVTNTNFPKDLKTVLVRAYEAVEKKYGGGASFAIRSSATAEDLPDASFAGEHETFLNISGVENILKAVRQAMASLFTERAISYRVDKKFDHLKIALSVGVQKMVRSDIGSSGVIFTLDTETGFPEVVLVSGAWGLGEMIVGGMVTPDEFLVFKRAIGKYKDKKPLCPIIDKKLGIKNQKMVYGEKGSSTRIITTSKEERENFVLSEKEVLKLAHWAAIIEEHYSQRHKKWTPMDIEWAKDGASGELFIVQARPETIHSARDFFKIKEYIKTGGGKVITGGASVGNMIVSGKARVILDTADIDKFRAGEILITEITDPDWEPIMKIAGGIITDQGGRTSHAAIVSRELGIPCIVGTVEATTKIKTGDQITIDTTGSEGIVYEGLVDFKVEEHDVSDIPKTRTKIMINIATPQSAFEKSFLPNDGVGLAREEFIIASNIGIHPKAAIDYHKLPKGVKKQIDARSYGYQNKVEFYIDKLAYGIARIATAFYPKPVIVRFSDFKTNEYRMLIGGEMYEPQEENPMLGWRGASRYYHPDFVDAFILELKAISKVRGEMGLDNVEVMVPFCRTTEEGQKVLNLMEKHGLARSDNLKVYVMCEIPANVILVDEFLKIFDGMSIGSNDLTQLALGIDRDGNKKVEGISNEEDEAVKKLITEVVRRCKSHGKYIGICGQAPSDYPDFAQFLVEVGIESISLNPDSVLKMRRKIYQAEQQR